MADMGFMPQVEWVLRRLPPRAPDDAVLGHARRRRGPPPVATICTTPSPWRSSPEQRRPSRRWSTASSACTSWTRSRCSRRSPGAPSGRWCSSAPSGAPTASCCSWPARGSRRPPSTVISARPSGSGRSATSRRASCAVLVATDVAARGIHVDSIDIVVHYDPPEDHKGYLHRSGRTARAGEAGLVVTLVLWDQRFDDGALQRRLGDRRHRSWRCSPTTPACWICGRGARNRRPSTSPWSRRSRPSRCRPPLPPPRPSWLARRRNGRRAAAAAAAADPVRRPPPRSTPAVRPRRGTRNPPPGTRSWREFRAIGRGSRGFGPIRATHASNGAKFAPRPAARTPQR